MLTPADNYSARPGQVRRPAVRPKDPNVVSTSPTRVAATETADAPPRLLVSLATYNEADNLRDLVTEIHAVVPHATVLVIDDNSPDGTGKIADELKVHSGRVDVIHRAGKQGLGTAILAAMRYAIEHHFDQVLNMDADGSHPPRYVPAILDGMRDHDVMIGSRYVPGGGVEGEFNLKRKLMSNGINIYTRIFLGLKTKDNSGSFRCYRVAKLAQIDFDRIQSRGYSFMEEILFWCRQVGCTFGETPIVFENRRAGVSKINKMEAVKALQIIAKLGVARMFGGAKIGRDASPGERHDT
jgi:dolichol-phosphate mannosyltransferase